MIVSSSRAFNQETASTEKLVLYASSKHSDHVIEIEFDRLPGIFYGTGDAFAAMVFAWLTRLNNDLKVKNKQNFELTEIISEKYLIF